MRSDRGCILGCESRAVVWRSRTSSLQFAYCCRPGADVHQMQVSTEAGRIKATALENTLSFNRMHSISRRSRDAGSRSSSSANIASEQASITASISRNSTISFTPPARGSLAKISGRSAVTLSDAAVCVSELASLRFPPVSPLRYTPSRAEHG